MTIDKYIAIEWPHKAPIYSTPEMARKTRIVILICVFIYSIPHLFLSEMVNKACLEYTQVGIFTKLYSWLSFSANAFVTFVMLLYMNCVIVQRVRNSRKMFVGNEPHGNNQGQGEIQVQNQINLNVIKRQRAMKIAEN